MTERSVNGYYSISALVPLNRLSWKIGADYLSARDRPGERGASRTHLLARSAPWTHENGGFG